MRDKFLKQLTELRLALIAMLQEVIDIWGAAINALLSADEAEAQKIVANDLKINQEQRNIENICFSLMIRQQPVAKDLRVVTAALKMVTDLERIGDHAADISRMVKKGNIVISPAIGEMARDTENILNKLAAGFVNSNILAAREVIDYDDVIDNDFDKCKEELIQQVLAEPTRAKEAADLLLIVKYFERVGDHATNLAEWLIYALKDSEY